MVEATASFAPPFRLLLGVVAGIVATRGMDVVMARLPEGETPPFVASGVLTEQSPDTAPARLAAVVHHVAGWLTGPLFVTLVLLVEGVLGGPSAGSYVLATAVLLGLMVGFFAIVVLPRVGLPDERIPQVRRDWTVSALAYLLVLVPLFWGGSSLLFRF